MREVITQEIGLAGIGVPLERLRALNPSVVEELASSIREHGLIHPILLRPRSVDKIGYLLVAGRHRLEAVRKLKWPSIRAEIREGLEATQAELAEIDENLVRAELSPAERDLHIPRPRSTSAPRTASPARRMIASCSCGRRCHTFRRRST